ncbi:MAG TPA: glycosyltransferase family 39 protein [Terriglobales bacterium]|jgi:hypothetical protein
MELPATDHVPAQRPSASAWLFPIFLLVAGFLVRLGWACWGFLNPDEAAHYLLSVQPSLKLAYQASLTTAHPPLLILLLHVWQIVGHSEIILRLPSVLAGTAFCWAMFTWMSCVTDRRTTLIAFTLLLFSPQLISLSAEIRQYSVLLMFAAYSLLFLERAIGRASAFSLVGSFLSLYLAILSHYSSFIFALVMGVYGCLRLLSASARRSLWGWWVAGELGGVLLAVFLFASHVSKLEDRNLPQEIADTWLRSSIYHRGEQNPLAFIVTATTRVFRFDFGNNVIGVVGLIMFLLGIFILIRDRNSAPGAYKPSARQLAALLLLPFVINCALAIIGRYPYGGTRHNALLIPFAVCAASVALSRWRTRSEWAKGLLVAIVLLISNIFPSTAGAHIRPSNQARKQMLQAVHEIENRVPGGSVVFADYQSGLLLSYYVCHDKVVQFIPPFDPYLKSPCGGVTVISTFPRIWIFQPEDFPSALEGAQKAYRLSSDTKLWVFQAGWLVDDEPATRQVFKEHGCSAPRSFGANIFLCQLRAVGS